VTAADVLLAKRMEESTPTKVKRGMTIVILLVFYHYYIFLKPMKMLIFIFDQ
jgi:hypothetical protein